MTTINYNELLSQKYTVVENVLSSSDVSSILEESVEWEKQCSKTRSVKVVWPGCMNLTDLILRNLSFVKLHDGRVDISLPEPLRKKIIPLDEQKLLSSLPKGFKIDHYNLLINPTNPNMQEWHQDNGGVGVDDYYTFLIPLVDEKEMGKTEVQVPYNYDFSKKAKVVPPDVTVGDGLLFSACLWHRGTPNLSKKARYCLYLIISRVAKEKLFEGWGTEPVTKKRK